MTADGPFRYRIRFAKSAPLRFIGHLDLHRTWERTLRRAGARLAYSEGYNPRPRLNLGLALPLGCTSQGDLLDVMNAMGWARMILAGHSMGGHNAMTFAAWHPERVAALRAVGRIAGGWPHPERLAAAGLVADMTHPSCWTALGRANGPAMSRR